MTQSALTSSIRHSSSMTASEPSDTIRIFAGTQSKERSPLFSRSATSSTHCPTKAREPFSSAETNPSMKSPPSTKGSTEPTIESPPADFSETRGSRWMWTAPVRFLSTVDTRVNSRRRFHEKYRASRSPGHNSPAGSPFDARISSEFDVSSARPASTRLLQSSCSLAAGDLTPTQSGLGKIGRFDNSDCSGVPASASGSRTALVIL